MITPRAWSARTLFAAFSTIRQPSIRQLPPLQARSEAGTSMRVSPPKMNLNARLKGCQQAPAAIASRGTSGAIHTLCGAEMITPRPWSTRTLSAAVSSIRQPSIRQLPPLQDRSAPVRRCASRLKKLLRSDPHPLRSRDDHPPAPGAHALSPLRSQASVNHPSTAVQRRTSHLPRGIYAPSLSLTRVSILHADHLPPDASMRKTRPLRC